MSKLKQMFTKLDKAWDESPSKKLINRLYWLTVATLSFWLAMFWFVWRQ